MNYEHSFHAGNPGDVLKHLALVLLLREMTRKQGRLHYFETHAGGGRYALDDKSGEWTQGVGKLLSKSARRRLPELRSYLELLPTDGERLKNYPGSPLIAAQCLRPDDRLELWERKPSAKAQLVRATAELKGRPLKVREGDGYAGLARVEVPEDMRLVTLIDPPYEEVDEWDALEAAIVRGAAKQQGAVFMLWYPIKKGPPHEGRAVRLRSQLERAHVRGVSVEMISRGGMLAPKKDKARVRSVLEGSGLMFVGAPIRALAHLAAALPELARTLARAEDGLAWKVDWEGWG